MPGCSLPYLAGARATRQPLSEQGGTDGGARSLVRCWCRQNPVHATAVTSSATLELALVRSMRAQLKGPSACVGPEYSLPCLAGARAASQPLSEQRGADGGARSLVRCWCTRNPVHATVDMSSAILELVPAQSRRAELKAPRACLSPARSVLCLTGARATKEPLSERRGAGGGARSLVRCWCTRNPVHVTADTSSATLELAPAQSRTAERKAPRACLGPGCSLPCLVGARATKEPLSERRDADGGSRSLVRFWCTQNPVYAMAVTSSATLELALARSWRAEPKAPCARIGPAWSLSSLTGACASKQPL